MSNPCRAVVTILIAATIAVPVACGGDDEAKSGFTVDADGSADGALAAGGSGRGGASPGGASAGGNGSGTGGSPGGGSSAGGTGTGAADGSAGDGSVDGGGPDGSGPTGCRSDQDCLGSDAGLSFCNVATGACIGCQTNSDCAPDQQCVTGTCTPLPTCTTSVQCRNDPDGKTICDTVAGACVECLVPADCDTGETCVDRTCRPECTSDNDCTGTLLCDTIRGICVACVTDAACAANQFCADGQCVPDSCVGGAQSCSGGVVIECNEAGSGVDPVARCTGSRVCVEHGPTASCDLPGAGDAGGGGASGSGGGANDAGPEAGSPGCRNDTQDGAETDTDCGGPDCAPCGTGGDCDVARDCASFVCRRPACLPLITCGNPVCQAPTCSDNVRNGNETDTDCGGSTCSKCGARDSCRAGTDCVSGQCVGGACTTPTCVASACPICLPFGGCCIAGQDTCGCVTGPFGGCN